MKELVGKHFDARWYSSQYPDVAGAGADPLEHFLEFGRFEGRCPARLKVWDLEEELWFAESDRAVAGMMRLLSSPNENRLESVYGTWFLARWHASCERWHEALEFLNRLEEDPLAREVIASPAPALLTIKALLHADRVSLAEARLNAEFARRGKTVDLLLAEVNMMQAMPSDPSELIRVLNQLFSQNGLGLVSEKTREKPLSIDNLRRGPQTGREIFGKFNRRLHRWRASRPGLVTVIIPAYNAEKTLATAIHSLLDQSWQELELIVVDDCSSDGTWEVAQELVTRDNRLKVLRHEKNEGAYVARNTGLAASRGDFIATHDSDDWSHPEKIEKQVLPLMKDEHLKATVSHWARCSPDFEFSDWRMGAGFVVRNPSSLMFKRTVFVALGYWDRVRVSADTEYRNRITHAFGHDAVKAIMPGIPLAFGRSHPSSLTRTAATHMATGIRGVRQDYHEAARAWHESARAPEDLYLSREPAGRPFSAPELIRADSGESDNP